MGSLNSPPTSASTAVVELGTMEPELLPAVVVEAMCRLRLFTKEIAGWEDAVLPSNADGRQGPWSEMSHEAGARTNRAELGRRVRERSKAILTWA